MISQRTVYVVDGKQFNDTKQVRTHIENCLGALIDSIPDRLSRKDALAVLEMMIEKRVELRRLLDGTIKDSGDGYMEPDANLFILTDPPRRTRKC